MPRLGQADAVTVLSAFLVLRFALPSVLTIGALGGAGSPAALFSLVCLLWWVYYQVQRSSSPGFGTHPVRQAAFVVWLAFIASYLAGMTRPIDSSERSVADLTMLMMASWLGALLLAHDGIPTWERAVTLIRRLVGGAGAIAVLGVIQSFTHETYIDRISIPGLTDNAVYGALSERDGFSRAAGTALHAIEFGSVLTMMLPFALALAFTDRERGVVRCWTPVLAISLAALLSVTRSAILGAVLSVVVLAMAMAPSARRVFIAVGLALGVFVFLTIPGLLGTLLGLFSNAGSDSSVQSRTGSYPLAFEFIARAPLFGRGPGTFLPRYRILDNQYLLLGIETGLVGAAAVLALVVTGIVVSVKARRVATDYRERMLCQACAASLAAGGAELALFDGFSFPMYTGLLFLVIGISGALWRLQRSRPSLSTEPSGQGAEGLTGS